MASTLLLPLPYSPPSPPLRPLSRSTAVLTTVTLNPGSRFRRASLLPPKAAPLPELAAAFQDSLLDLVRASPPTWRSAIASNLVIFVLGSPILASGLTVSGIGAAFLLGTLSWWAFGYSGFLVVASYFVIGTAATKLKIAQKEALGIAEKRRGRRGPGSVVGSSAAGCVCALLSIYNIGAPAFAGLWQLGFVASFCTKLSDTVSSEIGKAFGKTTYLVTTFKVVPRGTEGAVSLEGTIAGLLAAVILSSIGYFLGKVDLPQVGMCILASQIANIGESLIGATIQDKETFQWMNNDVVNVINISIGCILAMLMQYFILRNWHA